MIGTAATEEGRSMAGEIPTSDVRILQKKAGGSGERETGRMSCIKRHAVIAARAVKFLFALPVKSPYIATTASEGSEGKARKGLQGKSLAIPLPHEAAVKAIKGTTI